jgi:hypothetical protein
MLESLFAVGYARPRPNWFGLLQGKLLCYWQRRFSNDLRDDCVLGFVELGKVCSQLAYLRAATPQFAYCSLSVSPTKR